MKSIAAACLLLLALNQDTARGTPFSGRWVVRADNGDGTFRETVFALEQRASTLTGRVINPTNEQPIVDGMMTRIGFGQDALAPHAGPGHWNDPDMLEIGNGGMTNTEYRTHMSLWAILAAPLLAGNDLRSMSPETVAILTNRDVIAVDQDALGKQGRRIRADGAIEVWVKPLASGAHAVGLFNRGQSSARISVRWSELGVQGAQKVRDLWAARDLGRVDAEYAADVEPHGVALVRIER